MTVIFAQTSVLFQ